MSNSMTIDLPMTIARFCVARFCEHNSVRIDEVRNVLIIARKLLDSSGWTQFKWREITSEGALYCPIGSVIESSMDLYLGEGRRRVNEVAIYALACHLPSPDNRLGGNSAQRLARWNDRPERTKDEVIDLFDRTLAGLL